MYIVWDGVLPPCYVAIPKREDTFPDGIVRSLPIFFGFEFQIRLVSAGSVLEEKPHGCVEVGAAI